MITHIVLFKWKEGVTEEQISKIFAEIQLLKGKINGVVDVVSGKNFSEWGNGYTHALVVLLRDKDALDSYRKDPRHTKIIAEIEKTEEKSIGIDFEV